jgi:hypothetical protein
MSEMTPAFASFSSFQRDSRKTESRKCKSRRQFRRELHQSNARRIETDTENDSGVEIPDQFGPDRLPRNSSKFVAKPSKQIAVLQEYNSKIQMDNIELKEMFETVMLYAKDLVVFEDGSLFLS